MGSKRGKNNRHNYQPLRPNVTTNDYDVNESQKKLRQYNKHGSNNVEYTETLHNRNANRIQANSSFVIENQITESDYNQYDKLETRFYSFSKDNEIAHNNLRKSFELKVEKEVDRLEKIIEDLKNLVAQKIDSKIVKYYAIPVLSILVSIIWALSYQPLINKVDQSEKDIQSIKLEIKDVSNSNERLEDEIKEINDKLQNAIITKDGHTQKKK